MREQLNIFIAFFRSGMLGYGGGPSAIPLVHREVVITFQWMDDDEFGDVLALANALPGPINTKMAGYIGYRVGGYLGMITAIIATAVPTVILMILFLSLLTAYKDRPWVMGMSKAVIPIAGVLMGILTWDFVKKSQQSLGWKSSLIIIAGSTIAMELLGVHPAIIIFVLLSLAIMIGSKKKQRGDSE